MRIISDFRDYYDTAASGGVDLTCVFNRAQYQVDQLSSRNALPRDARIEAVSIRFVIIGFCGEWFPAVQVRNFTTGAVSTSYNADDAVDALDSEGVMIGRRRAYSFLSNSLMTHARKRGVTTTEADPVMLENFFAKNKTLLPSALFRIHRCPLLLVTRWPSDQMANPHIVSSPNLKEFHFQQIKDPYTAFQAIHQFISGVLGQPVTKPEPVDDKIMAAARGHDGKYSFRTPPKKGKK